MNRIKHSFNNSAWGIANKIVHIVFPFFLRAVIIHELGVAYVGLNGLFKSIFSMLSLTELGFGHAVVYSLYRPIVEGDTVAIRQIMAYLQKVYRWVGLIMMSVGLLIVPFLRFFVKNDTGVDVNYYLLYGMYLFHAVMSYWMFAYENSLFTAHQRSDINYTISFIISVSQYLLQIVVLIFTKNYYLYLAVYALLVIPQNLIVHGFARHRYPDLYPEGQPTRDQISMMTGKIKSLIGHRLGNTFMYSIDSIIISSLLGVSILARYDNYNYILTSIIGFLSVMRASMLASVGNKIVLDSKEDVYRLMNRLLFLWVGMLGFCTACFASLFQPFIAVWLGEEFLFSEGLMLCISLYFFVWQFRAIQMMFKDAAGLWEADRWKPYIGMVANVGLSILCVHLTQSPAGAMIPTMGIILFVYFPWEVRVLFKQFYQRSCRGYVLRVLWFSVAALVSAGGVYLLNRHLPVEGILGIICRAALCALMPVGYVILTCFGCEFRESVQIGRNILNKILGKLKKRSVAS